MKLGNQVEFHISTNDAGSSISFYKLMGFREIAYSKKPFKWTVLSDGSLNLFLGESEFSGLVYYAGDMQDKVSEIEGKGIEYVNQDMQLGDTWYKVVKDPNDFRISLVEDDPEYFKEIDKYDYEPRGRFSEISILSKKIKDSEEFWKKFGFKIRDKNSDDKNPGVLLKDGEMGIGLYTKESCSHYFESPAITYSDKNMPAIIKDLKDSGLKFQEELKNDKGKLTGAIALSPEGQAFFLFGG